MRSIRKLLLERLVRRKPGEAMFLAGRQLGVQSVTVALPSTSVLYRDGVAETVDLPMDRTIAPVVMQDGEWQAQEVRFLAQHAPAEGCVLLDIGANVGLVSRSVCHAVPQLRAAIAFEPHPGNFRLLQKNVGHLPHCHPRRAALGDAAGDLPFYVDDDNGGNYSLLADAVRHRGHRQIVVPCERASEDTLYGPAGPDADRLRTLPVLWKSDTQGFDEIIATTLPETFWHRVQAGVMEIARLHRSGVDREKLARVLKPFGYLAWSETPDQRLSVESVIEHSQGTDDRHADLLFARQAPSSNHGR